MAGQRIECCYPELRFFGSPSIAQNAVWCQGGHSLAEVGSGSDQRIGEAITSAKERVVGAFQGIIDGFINAWNGFATRFDKPPGPNLPTIGCGTLFLTPVTA